MMEIHAENVWFPSDPPSRTFIESDGNDFVGENWLVLVVKIVLESSSVMKRKLFSVTTKTCMSRGYLTSIYISRTFHLQVNKKWNTFRLLIKVVYNYRHEHRNFNALKAIQIFSCLMHSNTNLFRLIPFRIFTLLYKAVRVVILMLFYINYIFILRINFSGSMI